jgi:hypothetical protein
MNNFHFLYVRKIEIICRIYIVKHNRKLALRTLIVNIIII